MKELFNLLFEDVGILGGTILIGSFVLVLIALLISFYNPI